MFYILLFIIGIIAGFFSVKIYLTPQLKITEEKNVKIEQENKQILEQNQRLKQENIQYLSQQKELISNIDLLESQSKKSAEIFLKQNIDLAKEQLSQKIQYYKQEEKSYKDSYLQVLKDSVDNYIAEINEKNQIVENLDKKIIDLQSIVNAAVEANKRQQEQQEKQDFYKLQIPQEDLEEIKKLREVSSYLKNSEPLNKVIWKVYYEKPYTDLIGRVVGSGIHTGIYKITNLENQMCYVGQAVNIADRLKQHIKRGLGAEPATRNKLYPAMKNIGVENFSFEIIEQCDRSCLNEKEDYWQEYFKAKEFGYSIK